MRSEFIVLLFGVILFLSCKKKTQANNTSDVLVKNQPTKEPVQTTSKNQHEVKSLHCYHTEPSDKLREIINFTKNKGYRFAIKNEKDSLVFGYDIWNPTKTTHSITLQELEYIEIEFNKIDPINGNYYPNFTMIEFCFNTEEEMSVYYDSISHIVSKQEKDYGYLISNERRIIYVQTGLKMYSFIINELKTDFLKLIEN